MRSSQLVILNLGHSAFDKPLNPPKMGVYCAPAPANDSRPIRADHDRADRSHPGHASDWRGLHRRPSSQPALASPVTLTASSLPSASAARRCRPSPTPAPIPTGCSQTIVPIPRLLFRSRRGVRPFLPSTPKAICSGSSARTASICGRFRATRNDTSVSRLPCVWLRVPRVLPARAYDF